MSEQQLSLFCPFGGCGPYGWCPCSEPEEPGLEQEPDEDDTWLFAPGPELMYRRGRLRVVNTLPPLDHYPKAPPCP